MSTTVLDTEDIVTSDKKVPHERTFKWGRQTEHKRS